jgi:hypothetical protein
MSYFVIFLCFLTDLARGGGGRERAQRMWACPGTQPAVSARVLGERRAIRLGGGGEGGVH